MSMIDRSFLINTKFNHIFNRILVFTASNAKFFKKNENYLLKIEVYYIPVP